MRFYTFKERKPKLGAEVLIKWQSNHCNYDTGVYTQDKYVIGESIGVDINIYGDTWLIPEEDIIGWMPIEYLDEIKVGE